MGFERRTLAAASALLAGGALLWLALRERGPAASGAPENVRVEPESTAASAELRAAERAPAVAESAEFRAEAPRAWSAAPVPDLALAAALGRDGHAEIRLRDAEGRALRDLPVLVVPEQTWNWLCADPEGPERYLGNLRASAAREVLRSDAEGLARAAFLSSSGPLRAIAGEGAWVAASSSAFTSGRAEAPARLDLVLHPRAALELRAQNGAGEALPLLAALATPAAESGVAAVRASIDRTRGAPFALRLEPLPAGITCAVEATVLIDGRTRILRGAAVPERQQVLTLVLQAEADAAGSPRGVGEENPK